MTGLNLTLQHVRHGKGLTIILETMWQSKNFNFHIWSVGIP